MKSLSASPLAIPMAVLVALVSAAATAWSMSAIASPGNFKARLVAIAPAAATGRKAMTPVARYPVGSVCQTSLVRAADTVRTSLASKAANAGLSLTQAFVEAGGAGGAEIGALDVDLEATGDYAAVVRLFDSMEASRPMIFVDTVDIQPAGGAVTLKLSGQVYCWISVPR